MDHAFKNRILSLTLLTSGLAFGQEARTQEASPQPDPPEKGLVNYLKKNPDVAVTSGMMGGVAGAAMLLGGAVGVAKAGGAAVRASRKYEERLKEKMQKQDRKRDHRIEELEARAKTQSLTKREANELVAHRQITEAREIKRDLEAKKGTSRLTATEAEALHGVKAFLQNVKASQKAQLRSKMKPSKLARVGGALRTLARKVQLKGSRARS